MTERRKPAIGFFKMWERDSRYRTKKPRKNVGLQFSTAIADCACGLGRERKREWIFISLLINLLSTNVDKLISSIIHFHKTDNFEKNHILNLRIDDVSWEELVVFWSLPFLSLLSLNTSYSILIIQAGILIQKYVI